MRRWRGTIDVPPTQEGLLAAGELGQRLDLDLVYHDHLSRCAKTAYALNPSLTVESDGPRPWHMGPHFEGKEITPESLTACRFFVRASMVEPEGGESFGTWYRHWTRWIDSLRNGWGAVGVVTHNRNIQALYARHWGHFSHQIYDHTGPDFLTVHVYDRGRIEPWGGKNVPRGIYLIRHAPTEWGT